MTSPPVLRAELWLCADLDAQPFGEIEKRCRAVLSRVPACVWLRPTYDTPARALCDLAARLADVARAHGGATAVGDRLDVAVAAGVDGVHLGVDAAPPSEARRWLASRPGHPVRWISGAAHDAHAIRARASECDVLVVSPFREVPGKGTPLDVAGFARLVAIAPARRIVALGGILTERDARDAARAGAHAIAVRRALLETDDPAEACGRLRDAFVHQASAR